MGYPLLVIVLLAMLVTLQINLWTGKGSLQEIRHLKELIANQQKENAALKERNQALYEEVKDLRNGLEAIEERARSELGMIRKDETFFQIIND